MLHLTPVKEVDTLPIDKISTVVKIPLTNKKPANVLEEREFQIETPTSGPTTTIAASERGKMITDAPAINHVTTPAAVVSERENVEIAETPLPDPTVVHATPAGKKEIEGRNVAGSSWKRNRAHPHVVRQRSQKGCNSSITVTAHIHSAYGNDNSGNIMSYGQSPPGRDDPSYSIEDKAADIDRSVVENMVRPSLVLNPLVGEFVPASTKSGRQREEGYSVDWAAIKSRHQRNRRLPSRYADFQMDVMNQRPPTNSES